MVLAHMPSYARTFPSQIVFPRFLALLFLFRFSIYHVPSMSPARLLVFFVAFPVETFTASQYVILPVFFLEKMPVSVEKGS